MTASPSLHSTQTAWLQPLQRLSDLDQADLLRCVADLSTRGGTVLSAGMTVGRKVFADAGPRAGATRRILFLTDMDDMSSSQLGEQIRENAADDVYVSIVGMGVNSNSALTDTVT